MRHKLLFYTGLVISALCLYLSLRNTQLEEITAALQRTRLIDVALMLVALYGFYWLKALRWQLILRPLVKVKTTATLPAIMIGYSANLILPAQLGELVRTYVAARQFNKPASALLSNIALEKGFDLCTILIILILASFSGAEASPAMVNAGYFLTTSCLAIMLGGTMLVFVPHVCITCVEIIFSWLPARHLNKLIGFLQTAAEGLQVLRQPRLLSSIFATSLAQWILLGICIAGSLQAMSLDLSVAAVLLTLSFVVIGISVPTSPGFIGNIQLAYMLALAQFGVSASDAVAASIVYHLLAYISVLCGGIYYWYKSGISLRAINAGLDANTSEEKTPVYK